LVSQPVPRSFTRFADAALRAMALGDELPGRASLPRWARSPAAWALEEIVREYESLGDQRDRAARTARGILLLPDCCRTCNLSTEPCGIRIFLGHAAIELRGGHLF
jgi:hypothetical protein